ATGRLFPFHLRGISLVILLLNATNLVSIFTSSVYFENPLRIYTYLVNTLAWSLPALAYAETQDARAALTRRGRAFTLGTVRPAGEPRAAGGAGDRDHAPALAPVGPGHQRNGRVLPVAVRGPRHPERPHSTVADRDEPLQRAPLARVRLWHLSRGDPAVQR